MSELIEQYKAMASDGANFRGLSILQHRKQLVQLVREHKAKTLLDYGSGAGDAWRKHTVIKDNQAIVEHGLHRDMGLRWFEVTLYDPAFPEHDEKPMGKFDGVLCSDVLEHIPEAELDDVIARLFGHARSFVWASVCCRPAKKAFQDGTNLHVTQRPMEWWTALFEKHRPTDRDVPFVLVETP